MKKLNLNEAGTKAFAWGSILALPIPAVLPLASYFCGGRISAAMVRGALIGEK